MTETYKYNQRDRLTEITAETVPSVGAAPEVKERYYAALARQPSRYAPWLMLSFAGLLLSAALAPLSWIGLRDRRRRRQVRHSSIALFMCVCMGVDPERVYAMNDEAIRAHALMVAGIGALGTTVTTYEYDDNGNQIQKTVGSATTVYVFDAENRLKQFGPQGQAATAEYTYDADSVRNSKTVGTTTTYHLTDKNRPYAQVIEEIDTTTPQTPVLLMRYLYGDELIAQTNDPSGASPATSYFHYDGQMSTRQLTDDNATPSSVSVTDHYKYDAFGQQLFATLGPTANKYLYTGEQYDSELDQHYLRARYYDHAVGRFLTMDPFAGFSSDPLSLHRYVYGQADPISNRDPSGMFTLPETISVEGLTSYLQTLNTIRKGKETLEKIRAVFDYATVLRDIIKLLQGDFVRHLNNWVHGLLGRSDITDFFTKALAPSTLVDASFDLLSNIPRIAGELITHPKKLLDIVKKYNKPTSAFLIYLPTPYPETFLRGIPPTRVGFIPRQGSDMPIYVTFGPRRAAGRLIGLGITPNPTIHNDKDGTGLSDHEQFFRMDWHPETHPGRKGTSDLVTPWQSGEWHYHIPK